jgi:Zn-dependent protease
MTMTRAPGGAPAGHSPDPDHGDSGPGVAGFKLAHAIAARRYRIRVGQITIGFLGGATHGRYDLPGPRAQWRIAAAGPAASLVMAGICAAAAFGLTTVGTGRLAVLAVTTAAWLNVLPGVFSGLPGAGPDGGRIVRALTWARPGDPARSGPVAATTGQITGAVLAAAGLGAAPLGHPGRGRPAGQ